MGREDFAARRTLTVSNRISNIDWHWQKYLVYKTADYINDIFIIDVLIIYENIKTVKKILQLAPVIYTVICQKCV